MDEIRKICVGYIDEVIKPLLPNAQLGDWIANKQEIALHLHNFKIFKNSQFESTNNSDFIHFTSISNIVSIINSKSLLLSDLNLFDDNNEFKLANKSLDLFWDNPEYYNLKSQFFAFLFCPYSD